MTSDVLNGPDNKQATQISRSYKRLATAASQSCRRLVTRHFKWQTQLSHFEGWKTSITEREEHT